MLLRRSDPSQHGSSGDPDVLTPEEEAALHGQMSRVDEEKRLALLDVGPTWGEWFYYGASKWWIGLGLMVIDSWVIVSWLAVGNLLGLGLSLAAVVYAEFLLTQYLWHRPDAGPTRGGARFRPRWIRPFECGRWTPEASEIRASADRRLGEGVPDPKEFL